MRARARARAQWRMCAVACVVCCVLRVCVCARGCKVLTCVVDAAVGVQPAAGLGKAVRAAGPRRQRGAVGGGGGEPGPAEGGGLEAVEVVEGACVRARARPSAVRERSGPSGRLLFLGCGEGGPGSEQGRVAVESGAGGWAVACMLACLRAQAVCLGVWYPRRRPCGVAINTLVY